MGSTIEPPPMPAEDRKPAWRRACLAYREKRRDGAVSAAIASERGEPRSSATPPSITPNGSGGTCRVRYGPFEDGPTLLRVAGERGLERVEGTCPCWTAGTTSAVRQLDRVSMPCPPYWALPNSSHGQLLLVAVSLGVSVNGNLNPGSLKRPQIAPPSFTGEMARRLAVSASIIKTRPT